MAQLHRFAALAGALTVILVGCGEDGGGTSSNPIPLTTSSGAGASSSSGGGVGASGGGGAGASGGEGAQGGVGAQGGAGAAGGMGMGGTGLGGGDCSGGGGAGGGGGVQPVLVKKGDADKLLLQGMVVTPDTTFAGEVLIVGDTLTCVAATCAASPGAATASVVLTNGIILPGLIDSHNHILFDVFDETDWAPTQSYTNHDQWPNDPKYGAMVDTKQYLNGESGSPADLGCELDKYGELKGLVAGTTSIQGSATPGNKGCYASLARTIDQSPNDLPADKIQTATIFPSTASADGVCANFADGDTTAYVVHVAEGVDQTALNEFGKLNTISTVDGCLYDPKTTIIHGAALGDAELTTVAAEGMSLVWSPQSNVFLYGANSDLSKTANIPLALSKGINVALGPDWSIGGSQNILDELRFADKVDNTIWSDVITPKMLTQMVTTNAAKALGVDAFIGSLTVGKRADVLVIAGDPLAPYDALLAATPATVELVIVNGVPLYGNTALVDVAPASPGCEQIGVCCETKFVCVAETGGTAANKLGQTFTDITGALETALTDYDAMNLTQWKFAPIAPLVKCP